MKRTVFLYFLLTLLTFDALAQESTEKWIRVTLIEAARSDEFQIGEKLFPLENQLKNLRSNKENVQAILKNFRKFTPFYIAKPQPVVWGKKRFIPLDEKETIIVEITLDSLQDNFYPASIRWFVREGEEEKDILKIKQLKFNKKRCLFLFDFGEVKEDSASFKLLAIELIDPKSIDPQSGKTPGNDG